MSAANDGYDPRKSKVSDERMDAWNNSVVTGDLNTVPGIGPVAIDKLADPNTGDRITNVYQLFGKYLSLKGPDEPNDEVSVEELNGKFWFWLKSKRIVSHRSAIVLAVNSKVSTFMPGLHDANVYEDGADDDEEE